ncbi:MAG TPA: hypothetical protein VFF32_12840 [Dermatophilaceae bacterium]|nr:hypothetical protein [Dermatophilaceae bacterium]
MAVGQGMNRPAVLMIAGQLDSDQQTVADLMQRTSSVVGTLAQNWFGHDSSQFAADWATHCKQLQMAADTLATMSRHARVQATDQQTTSTS